MLVQHAAAALHERFGEGPAALVDLADLPGQLCRQTFHRLPALAVQLGDLPGTERFGVDPQIIQGALEALVAVAGADEPAGRAAGPNRARPLEAAYLVAVEIDAHPVPVEGGGTMVPAAVAHPGRRDGRAALRVTADIQTQGKERPVDLEGKEHAICVIFLAEDLAVAAQVAGPCPGAKGDSVGMGQRDVLVDPQGVFAGEDQGVAENAPLPRQRRPVQRQVGVPAVAAGVAALVAGDLVEGPMGDQAMVDPRRGGGLGGDPRRRGQGRARQAGEKATDGQPKKGCRGPPWLHRQSETRLGPSVDHWLLLGQATGG